MINKSLVLSDGERDSLLIDESTGIPHFYSSLYSTIKFRNKGLAANTIKKNLETINFLYLYLQERDIHLEDNFRCAVPLSISEIEGIAAACSLKVSELIKQKSNIIQMSVKTESHRMIPQKKKTQVGNDTKYVRLSYVALYVTWLAEYIGILTKEQINDMKGAFLSRRPPKKPKNTNVDISDEKGFQCEELKSIYQVIAVGSSENPFKSESVQVRNNLIIKLLHRLGIRRSEALSLRADNFIYLPQSENEGSRLEIQRQQDSKVDPRLNQPVLKTQPRIIEISADLADEIWNYIKNYRSKIKQARKHPFLFVVHRTGKYYGHPLSISGVDKIISYISAALGYSIHPHQFRHRWNYEFSQKLDALDEKLESQEEEDIRSYLMGWKQGSGTAATYNQRFIREKAWEIQLMNQQGVHNESN